MTVDLDLFHVGDGDCILMTATETNGETCRILIDGGRSGSFRDFAADTIYQGGHLDLICVSHIDNDHISGILAMLRDGVLHRVWQAKKAKAEAEGKSFSAREPRQPPTIGMLWHNSVRDQLDSTDEIGVSLANAASVMGGSLAAAASNPALSKYAANVDNLATGHRSAIELEERIKDTIPSNNLVLTTGQNEQIGKVGIHVIGPGQEQLDKLRAEWEDWVEDNALVQQEIREKVEQDEAATGTLDAAQVNPFAIATSSKETVTVPNLASLMLEVTHGDTTIVLTGDGGTEDILTGLDLTEELDRRHVDVFKVPHHGATANVDPELAQRLTADHYVLCGNGAHHNPEIEVLDRLLAGRLAAAPAHPGVFTFWFTSGPETPGLTASRSAHMQLVREWCEQAASNHPNFRHRMPGPTDRHLRLTI